MTLLERYLDKLNTDLSLIEETIKAFKFLIKDQLKALSAIDITEKDSEYLAIKKNIDVFCEKLTEQTKVLNNCLAKIKTNPELKTQEKLEEQILLHQHFLKKKPLTLNQLYGFKDALNQLKIRQRHSALDTNLLLQQFNQTAKAIITPFPDSFNKKDAYLFSNVINEFIKNQEKAKKINGSIKKSLIEIDSDSWFLHQDSLPSFCEKNILKQNKLKQANHEISTIAINQHQLKKYWLDKAKPLIEADTLIKEKLQTLYRDLKSLEKAHRRYFKNETIDTNSALCQLKTQFREIEENNNTCLSLNFVKGVDLELAIASTTKDKKSFIHSVNELTKSVNQFKTTFDASVLKIKNQFELEKEQTIAKLDALYAQFSPELNATFNHIDSLNNKGFIDNNAEILNQKRKAIEAISHYKKHYDALNQSDFNPCELLNHDSQFYQTISTFNENYFNTHLSDLKAIFNTEIKKVTTPFNASIHSLKNEISNLENRQKASLFPFEKYQSFYIPAKSYPLFLSNLKQDVKIHQTQKFDSPSLMSLHKDVENLTLDFEEIIHQEKNLENYESIRLKHQLLFCEIEKTTHLCLHAHNTRKNSPENQTLCQLLERLEKGIIAYPIEIKKKDKRRLLLNEIIKTIKKNQNDYLFLQIVDKKSFLQLSITQIETILKDKPLVHLSSHQQSEFILFVRHNLIRPLQNLLNEIGRVTGFWQENTITFFASSHERELVDYLNQTKLSLINA